MQPAPTHFASQTAPSRGRWRAAAVWPSEKKWKTFCELRGIDVTSAGVYRNELFRMFSYPVSGVTIDDAYRSDVMRLPPGCGMRNWRIV